MGGSGHADYSNAHDKSLKKPVKVPLKIATEESVKDYGRIVRDFDTEEVKYLYILE